MSAVEVVEVVEAGAGQPFPTPRNQNAGAKVNNLVLPQACRVYQFTAFSSNAAAQFVLVFEQTSLPADTAVPLMAYLVAITSHIQITYGEHGRVFRSGFVLCTSSTSTTKTINATADTFFDVQYDRID